MKSASEQFHEREKTRNLAPAGNGRLLLDGQGLVHFDEKVVPCRILPKIDSANEPQVERLAEASMVTAGAEAKLEWAETCKSLPRATPAPLIISAKEQNKA